MKSSIRRILWVVAAFVYTKTYTVAALCVNDEQCSQKYEGSKCLPTGECSNPFASGCLRAMEEIQRRQLSEDSSSQDYVRDLGRRRVCNSDDPANSEYCDESDLDYMEIVVHNGDWESAIFYAWITQIFLMEFLDVPVRVGMGDDSAATSFYNLENRVEYSSEAYAWEAIQTANDIGDCSLSGGDSCVHVLPEVWNGQERKWKNYLTTEIIDQVDGDGQVGKISWYVPAFTASRYPQFIIFHGLQNNREELARVFKRPTSWLEYCEEVSSTNCTSSDGVAERYPEPEEQEVYFQEGEYTGHFRHTSENNCTANPDTCTGHIVAPPCAWDTDVEAQTHWNNISLASSGKMGPNNAYSYNQMVQIWRAAAGTNSDVVMWWWKPDIHVEEFRGTHAEFQPVILPEATVECRSARIHPDERCHENPMVRQGSEQGSCDNEAHPLKKVIASSLRDITYATPEVDRSPAYLAIKNLKVGDLEMNSMFQQWVSRGTTGYAAREVVCEYVVEHYDELLEMIPRGYPRSVQANDGYSGTLMLAARGFGGFACLYVLVAAAAVYALRKSKVFVYAQVHFVMMVIVGWLLVSISSIIYTLQPETVSCSLQNWFRMLGYTMELVPLLVKVAAINRLMEASKKLKRVKMRPRNLYAKVALWLLAVTIYLTVYQLVDPPAREEYRFLMEDYQGEDEIVTTVGCSSDSNNWELVILCFEGFLIICATVMAFQSRHLQSEFNESKSLAFMTYSHFMFVVLRSVVFAFFRSEFAPSEIAGTTSVLLSLDVVSASTIYLVPKLGRAIYGKDGSKRKSRQSAAVQDIEAKAARLSAANAGRTSVADALLAQSKQKETKDHREPTPSPETVLPSAVPEQAASTPIESKAPTTETVAPSQIEQGEPKPTTPARFSYFAPQLSFGSPMDALQRMLSTALMTDGCDVEFIPSTEEFSDIEFEPSEEVYEDSSEFNIVPSEPSMTRQVSDGNSQMQLPKRVDSRPMTRESLVSEGALPPTIPETMEEDEFDIQSLRNSQMSAPGPESASMDYHAATMRHSMNSAPEQEQAATWEPPAAAPSLRDSVNSQPLPTKRVSAPGPETTPFDPPEAAMRSSVNLPLPKRPSSRRGSHGNVQLQVPRRTTFS